MGLRHAMRVLAEEWDDIRSRVPDDQLDTLVELATELAAEAVPADSVEIAEEIADLLGSVLPVEHPFRRALAVPESRLATGGTARDLAEWLAPAEALRTHVRGPDVPPQATPEEVMRLAKERLLSAPALTEAELRGRGLDPDDATLIRLDRPDGTAQWPAFQFGPDGRPHELVRNVNQLLAVADDPWGVADWWLGYNGWLRTEPVQLIGQVDGQELVDVARYELSEG
jgi:hypothetical protein